MKRIVPSNISGKKQIVKGPHVTPEKKKTETHCAPERFQAKLCLNIAVTQGEISVIDLKSAGKSAGQFNGHCFTQGGAFRA